MYSVDYNKSIPVTILSKREEFVKGIKIVSLGFVYNLFLILLIGNFNMNDGFSEICSAIKAGEDFLVNHPIIGLLCTHITLGAIGYLLIKVGRYAYKGQGEVAFPIKGYFKIININ